MSDTTDETAQLRARIAELESKATAPSLAPAPPTRRVSFPLGLGIFFVPVIFVWFLLRKGHTTASRVLGFGWLGFGALVWAVAIDSVGPAPSPSAPTASTPAASDSTVATATPPPASSALGVTAAGYSALYTGMTYEKASEILGSPGEELSSSDVAGTRTVMVAWKANNGFANMNAMFQNDRLVMKAQLGLR